MRVAGRRWVRRLVPAAVLLALAAGAAVWWWRADRLTPEEEPFVGYWTAPTHHPQDWANTVEVLAVEFRRDHTAHRHLRDSRTGARTVEYWCRWDVRDGVLTQTWDEPNKLDAYGRGEFSGTFDYQYRVAWDGPDRYTLDRIDLPDGVEWPTFVHVRCPPPEP